MAKDPAFLFYPNDYIGGTMGMTFEEKGAYIELLMLQFNRGHMTKHMIGQSIGQLWVNIQDKFLKDSKGLYYNKRLEDEQNKRKSYSESRKNNKLGINQFNKKKKSRGHMIAHMEDENINEDLNEKESENEIEVWPTFEDFWILYDKKSGDKRKCLKKWNKLGQLGKEFIMHHVEKYVKSTPDKQFRKNPETYLNQQHWENEILTNEENGRGNNAETVQKYIDIISEQGN